MKPTLTATRGISGCGKSHWARQEAARRCAAGRPTAVVERDALRDMVGVNRYGDTEGERRVTAGQRALVLGWLRAGMDVIVADTNIAPASLSHLRRLAGRGGARFEVEDFAHVPFEVCVSRNERRPERVPGQCSGAQIPPEGMERQRRRLAEVLAVEARQRAAQGRLGWRRPSSVQASKNS